MKSLRLSVPTVGKLNSHSLLVVNASTLAPKTQSFHLLVPSLSDSAGCPYHEKISKQEEPVKPFDQVPGPKGLPFIGNALEIHRNASRIHPYFLSLCQKYGDVVKFTVLNEKFLILAHPESMYELAKKEESRTCIESFRYFKQTHGYELAPIEMYNHENWQDVRQLFNVAMKPDLLERVTLPQLTELNSEYLKIVLNQLKPVEGKFLIPDAFLMSSRYAFLAVMKTFLGVKLLDEKHLPCSIAEFVEQSINAINLGINLELKLPLYRYFKTRQYYDFEESLNYVMNRSKECVALFQNNPNPEKPRLKEYIEQRAEGMERKERQIEQVLASFITGGVDITSKMIVTSIYRLAHHQDYQNKLYDECLEVFGEPTTEEYSSEHGLVVTTEQFKKLKLVKHFVDEVFRLNPFSYAPSRRLLSQDTVIKGYQIPKGTQVMLMGYTPGMKEDYVPQPQEFIPERHEKNSPLSVKSNYVT